MVKSLGNSVFIEVNFFFIGELFRVYYMVLFIVIFKGECGEQNFVNVFDLETVLSWYIFWD